MATISDAEGVKRDALPEIPIDSGQGAARAHRAGLPPVPLCGFVDARTAYLIYQLNSPEWHYLSPSLLHRAHLIEALMAIGVRELIFVHGCSGLLHRACDPTLVSQAWIRRPGLSAHLLTGASQRCR